MLGYLEKTVIGSPISTFFSYFWDSQMPSKKEFPASLDIRMANISSHWVRLWRKFLKRIWLSWKAHLFVPLPPFLSYSVCLEGQHFEQNANSHFVTMWPSWEWKPCIKEVEKKKKMSRFIAMSWNGHTISGVLHLDFILEKNKSLSSLGRCYARSLVLATQCNF